METLSLRALNRTTLRRQHLLERTAGSALEMVGHLVAMQGQEPDAPYVGLWTRLEGFRHDELTRLLEDRQVVRSTLLRCTQHLVTAADYPWLRALVQPLLERFQRGSFGRYTAGIDPADLAEAARGLLAGRTLTRPQLRDLLAQRWPDHDAQSLAWSAQALVPVVHPPPAGTWRQRGTIPFTLAEEWLGQGLDPDPDPVSLVRRYLAAFGPASVADLRAWSGITGLREVVQRLSAHDAEGLRTFRDETGRVLVDLPGAPLVDPDTPAPVRFLPEFDNVLLAYADRTRVIADAHRGLIVAGAMTVLVDGFVRATWTLRRDGDTATLAIRPLDTPLPPPEQAAVAEEGERLLAFAAAEATSRDIQVLPPG